FQPVVFRRHFLWQRRRSQDYPGFTIPGHEELLAVVSALREIFKLLRSLLGRDHFHTKTMLLQEWRGVKQAEQNVCPPDQAIRPAHGCSFRMRCRTSLSTSTALGSTDPSW